MSDNRKPASMPRHFSLPLILGAALIFIATTFSVASAMPPLQTDGEALFTAKGCNACHTIGGGDLVGPDLAGVTERRTEEWLTKWLTAPDQMLASDPDAQAMLAQYNNVPMPNLGLTPDEVAALMAYMGGGATTGGAAAGLPAGDATSGKAYFVGDKRFENGGPQCMSCHSVAGLGSLGGGNLGPDLTTSGFVQSDAAFGSFMSAPSTQTMGAIWANTPLTAQEQADLYAFLSKASVTKRDPSALFQIAALAVAGAAALIFAAQLYWGKRSRGVRVPMIERTLAKK
ncbi:MAG: cytochrome C [Chloroflexi bacterium]|nr:cytochrome c [Chloroflexi bacterium CFX1]MCK6566354.1 cytochrome c [Anaerolineales bacterium]MDL1919837.1 cytochrome c [Chloroflexi bacterium CFX5]NUQ60202.1 cytochrome c [Anaerolineales bacterium]RIK48378.1 MAG: cytochrome C [Chloroflexota bacterium]